MKKSYIVLLLGLLLLWGCEPKPNEGALVQHLVVTTNYDNTKNFSSYSTYYLPLDTLSYFNNTDNTAADTLQCLACTGYNSQLGQFAQIVTTQVKKKLDSLGYTQVPKNQSPDLKVYVFIVDNYSVSQSLAYNPYGYGFGYGYGYGYGSYYPVTSVSENEDLWIYIFDLKHLYNSQPSLIWTCDIGDIQASLSVAANQTGLTISAINQGFKQSSYIKK